MSDKCSVHSGAMISARHCAHSFTDTLSTGVFSVVLFISCLDPLLIQAGIAPVGRDIFFDAHFVLE
jgi:hypothetical protein